MTQIFFLALLLGFHPVISLAGQAGKWTPEVLEQWADPETVQNWGKAIRAGRTAWAEGRIADAASAFGQAVEVCNRTASGGINQCIARLLLAEALIVDGRNAEALSQTDRLVAHLGTATRYTKSGKLKGRERFAMDGAVNSYKYQAGAALYLRAARIYIHLNLPKRAEPLFKSAAKIFDQIISEYSGPDERIRVNYSLSELRLAEIYEAECRFHMISGNEERALECLQTAHGFRKEAEVYRDPTNSRVFLREEMFLDQLVAQPLDKSFLGRFLEDCAFYRFDDAQIADLLVRQADLLRRMRRNDEATAFEKFAESLRQRPATRRKQN
jgi:tetratricopeptide (TPR) repeat protein